MKTIRNNWKVALIVAAGIVAVILLCVFGIVEFSDGVRRVDPSEIVFCDEENQMLSEMEKMRKEKEAND